MILGAIIRSRGRHASVVVAIGIIAIAWLAVVSSPPRPSPAERAPGPARPLVTWGRVVDEGGAGVPGAEVTSRSGILVRADAEGRFSAPATLFEDRGAPVARIVARDPLGRLGDVATEHAPGDAVVLARTTSVSGIVEDAGGRPLADRVVWLAGLDTTPSPGDPSPRRARTPRGDSGSHASPQGSACSRCSVAARCL